METLVTGVAGFIGFHTAKALLDRGDRIIGIDCINNYYDPELKANRIKILEGYSNFEFHKFDLTDYDTLNAIFNTNSISNIIHLAAQAGVRYSIENPQAYIESNIICFSNVLECARRFEVRHFTYASSSSVYGANELMPFSPHNSVSHPLSLYAATKKSNELFAHSYSHLYRLPTTGLRFFSVYGPWGRPDMALFIFTRAILENRCFDVFNNGDMLRDFTYIDDIVKGIIKVSDTPANPNSNWDGFNPDPATSKAPYRIYNIGNNSPVKLMDFISAIEDALDIKAKMNMLPMQDGDVPAAIADVDDLVHDFNYKPETPIKTGINNFITWYKEYYGV